MRDLLPSDREGVAAPACRGLGDPEMCEGWPVGLKIQR